MDHFPTIDNDLCIDRVKKRKLKKAMPGAILHLCNVFITMPWSMEWKFAGVSAAAKEGEEGEVA